MMFTNENIPKNYTIKFSQTERSGGATIGV